MSKKVNVVATIKLQEDKVQWAIENAIAELVKKSREEEGVIFYDLFVDAVDPTILVFNE